MAKVKYRFLVSSARRCEYCNQTDVMNISNIEQSSGVTRKCQVTDVFWHHTLLGRGGQFENLRMRIRTQRKKRPTLTHEKASVLQA